MPLGSSPVMMQEITSLLAQYGLAFVFLNLFLEQAGVPVPAIPTLMVAGALAVGGGPAVPAVVAVAVLGSLLGDLIWYIAGRIYGFRVLQLLCRISISPDSCVRQTETRFVRWGAPSLVLAKFVPGFATVAPPVAGALQLPLGPFLAYSTIGATLYAALAAGAGMFFYREIDWLIGRLAAMGIYALFVLALALGVFIAFKWWERRRFFKVLRMARIPVPELRTLMDQGRNPLVVDVRSASARSLDPRRIPGALAVDIEKIDEHLSGLPPDRDIILYCA
jgi:membrane protein DedA with SNARE-associated domain